MTDQTVITRLSQDVRACTLCSDSLPLPPRPVVQLSATAKILIAGQAPGAKVQASGIPFDDASGERLRQWMGIDKKCFYDAEQIAILPMGFCYPGRGKSGDLPPRPECAEFWRQKILDFLPNIQLTLVIGLYAQNWHLKERKKENLTSTVQAWQEYWPEMLPLPHPSPRNNPWLKKNAWFECELVPALQRKIIELDILT